MAFDSFSRRFNSKESILEKPKQEIKWYSAGGPSAHAEPEKEDGLNGPACFFFVPMLMYQNFIVLQPKYRYHLNIFLYYTKYQLVKSKPQCKRLIKKTRFSIYFEVHIDFWCCSVPLICLCINNFNFIISLSLQKWVIQF